MVPQHPKNRKLFARISNDFRQAVVHPRPCRMARFVLAVLLSEVIRAEKLLKRNGWEIRVMGPPPEIRQGCDLVIEFPLIEELQILRSLEAERLPPLKTVPVTGPLLQPVDIFQFKDYGRYLMVRAANMKLTVDRETGVIVNISGGGCPDVPFLASSMVGRTLADAPSPRDIGHTLCGYALQLAYEEVRRRCSA